MNRIKYLFFIPLFIFISALLLFINVPLNSVRNFVNFALAQPVASFDLLNLNESRPELVGAYLTLDKIKLEEMWELINNNLNISLNPVKIGIIDTRLDGGHPEFEGVNLRGSASDLSLPQGLLSFLKDPHGTGVTGIIGANNVLGTGGTIPTTSPHMNGIISGVSRLNYTIEFRGANIPNLRHAKKSITDLAEKNVSIINYSLGGNLSTFLGREILTLRKKIEKHGDILFIVAAGQGNKDAENISPANLGEFLDNVVSVGFVDNQDTRIEIEGQSSNFGDAVDIAAPGKEVYVPSFFDEPLDFDDYQLSSGTSFSAPMVTGVAGLLKAINPLLTPAQIKHIITTTADPIFTTDSNEITKTLGSACDDGSPTFRGCRLNALAAVCDSLVLDCEPKGTLIFEDDFETYTLGDLAGQGGWEPLDPSFPFDTSVHIVDTQAFSGNQSIEQQYIDHRAIKRIDTPVEHGSVVFWSMVQNRIDSSFQLSGNANSVPVCGLKFDDNNVSTIAGQGAVIPNTASLQLNVWRKTEIQWNAEDNTCRFSINDGEFTPWLQALTNFTNVDTMALQANFPGAINQNMYYDLVQVFEF